MALPLLLDPAMECWTKKFGQWRSAGLVLSLLYRGIPPANAELPLEKAPLYLEVGEQRSLEFPQLLQFSVSGQAIRYTRLRGKNRILIKAVKAGIAQLEVLEGQSASESTLSTRKIRVEQRKQSSRSAELLQAISRLQELEVVDSGKRFVIRGSVRNLREANAVAELREQFAEQILDESEVETAWLETLRPRIRGILNEYPHVRLAPDEQGLLIRGAVPGAEALRQLERRIRAVIPLARFDLQTLQSQQPTLYFKIYLLEMKRETLRSFGVQWPNTHPVSLQVATFDRDASLGGPTRIDLSVQALSEKGQLKILSSPELVVRCPGQAELFAGGELPIRQRNRFNDNINWKSVGLSLRLQTQEYSGEKVRLNVETELSHLDGSLRNDEIPGVKSNRIKTQVDATLGRPLFLSGLLQEDWSQNVRGLPGLADIPILGRLFSSEDYRNQRSELVAILVPSRDPPQQPITRLRSGLPKGFLPMPREPLSSAEMEELRVSSDYPWNALR